MGRRVLEVLEKSLVVIGLTLLLLSVGVLVYPSWAEEQHRRDQPAGVEDVLPEQLAVATEEALVVVPTVTSQPTPVRSPTPVATALEFSSVDLYGRRVEQTSRAPDAAAMSAQPSPPVPTADPTAEPTRVPDPAASSYGPAVQLRIPRIGVNSHITDVGLVDGYYEVPWWDVGHHADSASPGEPGNRVFNGHVLTIDAGQVFRYLKQLRSGDAVYVYTPGYRTDWVVSDVFTTPAEDNDFLGPTDDTRITLYTCTGTFNPIQRTFSHRLVVVGHFVQAIPRS
jgi:LPXTG-site transpeptidase (sortase) family protein